MSNQENKDYCPRFAVIIKTTTYSRGYEIQATDALDLLEKLAEHAYLPSNAEIIYSEILCDSDFIGWEADDHDSLRCN